MTINPHLGNASAKGIGAVRRLMQGMSDRHHIPLDERRRRMAALGARFSPRAGISRKEQTADGFDLRRTVTFAGPSSVGTVLYLHGGAFVSGSPESHAHLVDAFAAASNATYVALDYRLAPEHPCPAAILDAVATYTDLVARTDPQLLAVQGDSAGGGLALAAMMMARDRGLPMPAALVLVSPWLDLTCSAPSTTELAEADFFLTRAGLLSDAQLYQPAETERARFPASPLFGNLAGLPPMFIQVGGSEIIRDDAIRLVERVRQCGGVAELEIWEDMIHVWHLFLGILDEAEEACDRIGDYLAARFDTATQDSDS